MSIIKINDKDYETDDLSSDAKAQLEMLISADNKLRELQRDLAIIQTARNAYANALQAALPVDPVAETIKFS